MKINPLNNPVLENKPKYLNLLTDFGFKKMFGEPNKKFLIAFLNAVLTDSVGTIEDVVYLNTEQLGENPQEKKMVYDIYCLTEQGQHIIVELQIGGQPYYGERAFTYVSRLVSQLAEKGAKKYAIPPIFSINILNFKMTVFNDPGRFLWEIQMKDQTNKVFLPQVKFIFIELCTFARLFKESDYRDALHCWLYIIKNMGNANTQECPFDDPIYRDFFEQGKLEKLTTMEKEDYAKSIFDYQDVKDTIEYERECAREEGRVEGRVEGKIEGFAEGKAEAKLDIAKLLLEQGVNLEIISKTTGLTAEEIKK